MYERVSQTLGGPGKVDDFMKLYLVPGMKHCGGGRGVNAFGQYYTDGFSSRVLVDDPRHDVIHALEAWVVEGSRPSEIITTKYVENIPEKGVAFTRPLCVYPKVWVYRGVGVKKSASSFECQDPSVPN